jgi:hypothetical protein
MAKLQWHRPSATSPWKRVSSRPTLRNRRGAPGVRQCVAARPKTLAKNSGFLVAVVPRYVQCGPDALKSAVSAHLRDVHTSQNGFVGGSMSLVDKRIVAGSGSNPSDATGNAPPLTDPTNGLTFPVSILLLFGGCCVETTLEWIVISRERHLQENPY